MTTREYQAIKKHLNIWYDDDELREMLDDTTGRELVKGGCFACTYSDAWDAMAEWYGDKFDASRYISPRATGAYWDNIDDKDYYLKMRGNKPYLWTVYVDKVATALEKIKREGEKND
jgi:hypothetical protein